MSPQATRSTRGGGAAHDAPMTKPQLATVHTAHRFVAAESTRSLSTTLNFSSLPPFMNNNDAISSRPVKRQKLDLRFRQSTLDTHFFARDVPPPTSNVEAENFSTSPELDELVLQSQLEDVTDGPESTPKDTNARERVGTVGRVRSRRGTPIARDAHTSSPSRTARAATTFDSKTLGEAGLKLEDKQDQRQLTPSTNSAIGRTQEDRRSLRSHDEGPRFKSELATYFSNYEDVMFDLPKSPEFISIDSTLFITDDAESRQLQSGNSKSSPGKNQFKSPQKSLKNTEWPESKPADSCALNGCQRLDLNFTLRSLSETQVDPLSDVNFYKAHRRAERREKQMRNIEKERAMHEKVQLDSLLNGLLGHDWLRVMGISGVTESEAKKFETKRDHFVAEVETLVNKFHAWKKEEKRQRLQKDEARRATEGEGNGEGEEDEDANETQVEPAADEGDDTDSLEPSSSDLNASAAQQLRQEAAESLKSTSQLAKARSKSKLVEPVTERQPLPPPPPPLKPMVSFYEKRHLRDAALRKARHGRNATAFGQPIPHLEEQDFELPADLISEDILRANARERRARNRRSIADAATSTHDK